MLKEQSEAEKKKVISIETSEVLERKRGEIAVEKEKVDNDLSKAIPALENA
jgi:hypothetical protein